VAAFQDRWLRHYKLQVQNKEMEQRRKRKEKYGKVTKFVLFSKSSLGDRMKTDEVWYIL
jgi:hypothetical protein